MPTVLSDAIVRRPQHDQIAQRDSVFPRPKRLADLGRLSARRPQGNEAVAASKHVEHSRVVAILRGCLQLKCGVRPYLHGNMALFHILWLSARLLEQRAIMTPFACADGQSGPPVKTGGAIAAVRDRPSRLWRAYTRQPPPSTASSPALSEPVKIFWM
jgi:hypothetical protein